MAGDSPQRDGDWAGGLSAGSVVASYRIEAQAGAGGMAVVYRARDERLGRTVALKVLAPGLAADPGFRQRFIRESRSAAMVDHPHIIPVYDADESDGILFIAMRFVSGGDLRSLAAREGPLPAHRAAAFIAAAASALDAAHAAGLVHRDVKPANMLIDTQPGQPDHLYLSDFGLTKGALSAGSASLTRSAEVFGTPDYLAPEQASGAVVDGQADQYALACSAFTLLAGTPVFERDHPMAVLLAHVSAQPPPVTGLRPDLPAAADQVLAKALAKNPADRYPSCGQFATALTDALALPPHATIAAATPPAPEAGALDHAQTLTAAAKAVPRPPAPAPGHDGHPITTAITAPGEARPSDRAVQPASKRLLRTARRRAVVALAALLTAAAVAAAAIWILGNINHPPAVLGIRGATDHHPPAGQEVRGSRYVVCAGLMGSTATATRCDPEEQPRGMAIGSDNTAVNLKWTGWGSTVATGHGTSDSSNCNPSCANGQMLHQPTTITVSKPEPYRGGMAYTRVQTSGGVGAFTFNLPTPSSIPPASHDYALKSIGTLPDPAAPSAFSLDGKTLIATAQDGSYDLWDLQTGTLTLTTNTDIEALALSPDGKTLAATYQGSGGIYLSDVATSIVTATLPDPDAGSAQGLAFSPDGKTLAISDDNGKIYLWDLATRTLSATLTDPGGMGGTVMFSPDSKTLAISDGNGKTYMWDVATGTLIAGLTIAEAGTSLAFSPDSRTLAIGAVSGTYLVNVATGTITATLTDPGTQDVYAVAFSPDGKTLTVSDYNDRVYLWNVATRALTATLAAPSSAQNIPARQGPPLPSPDGNTLAIAGPNNRIDLWNIVPTMTSP